MTLMLMGNVCVYTQGHATYDRLIKTSPLSFSLYAESYSKI